MSDADLTVTAVGGAADAITAHVPQLVADGFAGKLFAQDATLWGPDAESEAGKRLSWVGLGSSSRPLVAEIEALRGKFADKGLDHVVLCGMGGSSLAPEVICGSDGVPLTVLDSSQPDMVRAALEDRLEQTVVVVSSKSGSTVETDSQRRVYEKAFQDAGIDPTERIVVVTDPGSPLDKEARDGGFTVFNADPGVGGRYSALTAFGLVPSGLAGADIGRLLDEAEAVTDLLASDDEANPALRLGAALGGTQPLRDKIVLIDAGTKALGFGDWAEQLIAESTGKNGKGLLPVVVGDSPVGDQLTDELYVRLVAADDDSQPSGDAVVDVGGSLGGAMLLWEAAVATAGRLIGINPFDQPDVESAKAAARDLLGAGTGSVAAPAYTDGAVEVRSAGPDFLGDAGTVGDALRALFAQLPDDGYLAVMAYVDRIADGSLADVRIPLARKLSRPVTFGFGPRFLHSTGQYHKGGPANGVFLQITTAPAQDLDIPGREFTFGDFIDSQSGGDAKVLAEHGRPVLRLNLTDHEAGLAQLQHAISEVTAS
ncbi:glucose-6-phosphate isomerase [Flexivirga endophytica]|uniref:Glucose-6-phosphate isomerase n=1 Tax=Flexivirga endophytica TaxID=1849103 RepID=A0A916T9C2_9MICO|nr:glucose-6-phosphate isomerase [Flexivirga endophytica]GGB34109.1 glucose-6-phosphate isomerase [Flexivirga endophytica]GHB42069.1 glucose-6-phosphate isomerase [Flexivirga endophytica]